MFLCVYVCVRERHTYTYAHMQTLVMLITDYWYIYHKDRHEKPAKQTLKIFGFLVIMAESEELKSFLMRVKEESEKVSLKLNIQKTKRSNQSILKDMSPGCSLEGMMVKLKL